jgi:hypothetical protein
MTRDNTFLSAAGYLVGRFKRLIRKVTPGKAFAAS